MNLFQTQGLCRYYRAGTRDEVRALDDMTLDVARGSVTVLSGPSGAGKSTLLALLGALDRPTRGEVHFDGKDLAGCSDVELARARRRMGFVFQDFALIADLSVYENITYPLIPRGLSRGERRRRTEAWLTRLGLESRMRARAGELSGGEQQRVAVARALAGEPEVILADEPTSNLDVSAAEALRVVFRDWHAAGKTLILSSHDPALTALGTRVYRLAGGKLVD